MAIRTTVTANDSQKKTVKINVKGVDEGPGGTVGIVRTKLSIDDSTNFKFSSASGTLHADSDKDSLVFVWEEVWTTGDDEEYDVVLTCEGGTATATATCTEKADSSNTDTDTDNFGCTLN